MPEPVIVEGNTRAEFQAVDDVFPMGSAKCPCWDYQMTPNEDWTSFHVQILAERVLRGDGDAHA